MKGHTAVVTSVVVTKDNKYVISGSGDNTIRIGNFLENTQKMFCKDILFENKQETVLKGHTDSVKCVALNNDYKYFVSGSSDKTIILGSFLKKKQETALKLHASNLKSLAVTSYNNYIVSGFEDNVIGIGKI